MEHDALAERGEDHEAPGLELLGFAHDHDVDWDPEPPQGAAEPHGLQVGVLALVLDHQEV